jgi:hypothetical protein
VVCRARRTSQCYCAQDIGTGDDQILRTTYGDVLLIREDKSDGVVKGARGQGACGPATSSNVPYVVLPPVLTQLWAQLILRTRHWVWPVYDHVESGRGFDFLAADVSGGGIARAVCTAEGTCSLTENGKTTIVKFIPGRFISIRSVDRYAPPTIG